MLESHSSTIFLGSTAKMGAGTNFQKHLVALHHLDCPWRPRDIEQREGRILRSDPTINELDDISEISASYEDIASTAYENPLMSEEAKLSAQLRRLRYSKSIFAQQQRQTAAEQKKLTAMIPLGEKHIGNLKADIADKIDTKGDAFRVKIGDTVYTKRAEAVKVLDELIKNFRKESFAKVGEIGGFDIKLRTEHTLALRGGVMEVLDTRVFAQLANRGTYSVEPSLKSMEHFVSQGGIEKELSSAEKKLKATESKLAAVNEELAKSFPKQDELNTTQKRLEEVRAQLNGNNTSQKISEPDKKITTESKPPTATSGDDWFKRHVVVAKSPEADADESISKMNAALREVSEKIINDAAKNPDVARALEQLGAKIVDGKVTYPDDKTFQACVNLVNSGIVKSSQSGNVDTTIKNFIDPQDLNSFQRAFATFAKEMGVPIVFFRGAKNFHGAHANGISFYNADANFSHEWVYWHEFGHWLKNNQPELFGKLSDATNVTDKQISAKRKSRPELSDEDLREEIICDAMGDVARRAGIFQQFAKKNQSLIQRLMSWAKSTLDKFTDWFHTRERGLTTAQRAKMYDAFGKIARQIEDADGRKIFRYNSRTHEVELATGEKLPETKNAATEGVNTNADNKRITQKARELLKAVGLENRRPKSEEKLGKVYGQMERDGTFTAEIKLKDAEKLESLKSMADEIGATYNENTNKFHFDDIESVAVFFKAARTAFHDKTSSRNNYDRQVSGTAGVELPEGYSTETGKSLRESNVRDFIVDAKGNKDFGEITPEIERKTNGLVKAAPIRLQVGDRKFGYIHITNRHLNEITAKGFPDSISYINNILQNIDRIYISAETGSLNRFLLCSNGERGHSDNFMPIDLELEQGEDGYYRIVTAYPKGGKNVEGILLFDDSTHSSSVTATDSLPQSSDDKSGVRDHRANAKSNIPSAGTIPQSEDADKPKYSLEAGDDEYLQAVEDFKNAKTDDQRRSTFRKLTDMVGRAAEAAGFTDAIPEQTIAYKVRTGAAPKKTVKVYKVFTVANDGSPTALFVGGTEKLPQNVWLDAQDAWHFKAKNGKYYVPSTQNPYTKGGKTGASVEIPDEATRQELIKRGFLPQNSKATKITALAYRPGWHAGTLPFFPQGGMKRAGSNYENIHRRNQVVFECELAAEKNYTSEAEAQPKAR